MAAAARTKSVSAVTMAGSLPPSSNCAGMKRRAAASATLRPVGTLPVKHTWSTTSMSAAPVLPSPSTTPTTAATVGTSASAARKGPTKRGVTSLGLMSVAHPASKAGMASMNDSRNGKFHGEMTPTSAYGTHKRWVVKPGMAMSRGALPWASNAGACLHQRVSVSRTPRSSDCVSMARPVSAWSAAIMAASWRPRASRNSSKAAARASTPIARQAG